MFEILRKTSLTDKRTKKGHSKLKIHLKVYIFHCDVVLQLYLTLVVEHEENAEGSFYEHFEYMHL